MSTKEFKRKHNSNDDCLIQRVLPAVAHGDTGRPVSKKNVVCQRNVVGICCRSKEQRPRKYIVVKPESHKQRRCETESLQLPLT